LQGYIGNLAIMITQGVIVDPWLCVPAFQRVCLYRTNIVKVPIKRAWLSARLAQGTNELIFGNLAIMITRCVTVDPWLCVAAFQRVCYYRMV
jgi:hypothetical protein